MLKHWEYHQNKIKVLKVNTVPSLKWAIPFEDHPKHTPLKHLRPKLPEDAYLSKSYSKECSEYENNLPEGQGI